MSVVDRDELEVFAVTEKLTVPLPAPVLPDVIVSQPAPLVADHAHEASVVTLTLPVPLDAPRLMLEVETVGAHVTEKENVFESVLVADPPGPSAEIPTV